MSDLPCQCSHPAEAHEHWRSRPASDCGACGPLVCPRYRPVRPERPVLTWLRERLERVRGVA